MQEREELAQSLRTTIRQLNAGRERAKSEGRSNDVRLLSEMKTSAEFALKVLTDSFWAEQPHVRILHGAGRSSLTDNQQAQLDMVTRHLTEVEHKLLRLCLGYDVPLEAARFALRLDAEEADAVYESMVRKVKRLQRQALGVKADIGIWTLQ